MIRALNRFMLAHASGRNVWLLLGVAVISFWLMAGVIAPKFQDATDGLRPFDLNFGISADTMYRDLPSYTPRSRSLYVWFAVADFIYPAAAAGFFALLWAWMFNKTSVPLHDLLIRRGVLVIPFLFAMTDWLENIGFLIVVFAYPQEYRAIGTLSGTLKGIKPFVEIIIVLLTLVFVASTLWALKRRKQN
jgi:hypothetical protein